MAKIGRERGWLRRPASSSSVSVDRSAPISSGPRTTVAAKIVYEHELFGFDRFLIQLSVGTLPHREGPACDRALRHEGRADVRREVEKARSSRCPPATCRLAVDDLDHPRIPLAARAIDDPERVSCLPRADLRVSRRLEELQRLGAGIRRTTAVLLSYCDP